MSRPKYWWYGNVLRVIRAYPAMLRRAEELKRQAVTPSYSGLPGSGRPGRRTEQAALRELSQREQQELEAVGRAIEDLGRAPDGKEILRVVELYHWQGIRNFETVAEITHLGRNTAKRRNARFIYTVAAYLGYL